MFWYTIIAAAVTGVLTYLAYWAFLVDLPGVAERIGSILPYVVIATAAIGGAVWHLKSVRRDLGEMVAMMVGMTFGMIAGFLAGYFVGATNGMFIGSVYGVLVGCALGWYVGDCCAMMARMEGLMAGLMSGVMGAMTAVMLLTDRIAWFTPFLLVVNFVILSGLTYLVHREHRTRQGVRTTFTSTASFGAVLIGCFLATTLTIAVMVLAPMSVLFLGFAS